MSTRCWGKLLQMENIRPILWAALYIKSCSVELVLTWLGGTKVQVVNIELRPRSGDTAHCAALPALITPPLARVPRDHLIRAWLPRSAAAASLLWSGSLLLLCSQYEHSSLGWLYRVHKGAHVTDYCATTPCPHKCPLSTNPVSHSD